MVLGVAPIMLSSPMTLSVVVRPGRCSEGVVGTPPTVGELGAWSVIAFSGSMERPFSLARSRDDIIGVCVMSRIAACMYKGYVMLRNVISWEYDRSGQDGHEYNGVRHVGRNSTGASLNSVPVCHVYWGF